MLKMLFKKCMVFALTLLTPILASREHAMPSNIATTENGMLKGITGTNIDGEKFYKFLGIPYGKPPINELRFQPPVPAEGWTGVRDARQAGNRCIGPSGLTTNASIAASEDCLYLNVYTKAHSNPSLPLKAVMAFIHGGGLTEGSSSPDQYGPEYLLLKDIVLVTLNYRLGALGFLSFNDSSLGVPGNMGLKDQVLALKWVNKNIRNFNGDPNNITIFGNSAGSSSVHAHILSPSSKGLFHKAILQSGCVLNPWFWGTKNNARELVSKAGKLANTDEVALEILKKMSASDILEAQEKIYDPPYPAERRPFSAVIEVSNYSPFLTKTPIESMITGDYNHVPMILGYTRNEGMLLDFDMLGRVAGREIPEFKFENIVPFNLNVPKGSKASEEILTNLSTLYSGESVDDRYGPMTDGNFLIGIAETLKLHLRSGQDPIYIYRMSLEGKLNLLKGLMNRTREPGVCHADELGYIFHATTSPPVEAGSLEDRSIRAFVELWTNFALYGNPTPSRSLNMTWTPVVNEDNIQVLDIGNKIEMKDFPEKTRMKLWQEIVEE